MFGGGNLGMIAGMVGAGYAFDPTRFGAAGHLAAMSAGMIFGMLAGHFLVFRALFLKAAWSKAARKTSAGISTITW